MAHAHCGLRSVQINNLYVAHQGMKVLDGINLTVHCGGLTALIGKNGAGKTTLLRALLGENTYRGEVLFLDEGGNPVGKPAVGYVPQNVAIDKNSPVTVTDLFATVLSHRPAFLPISQKVKQKAQDALALVEATHLLKRRLGALSGGELSRVMLAFALTNRPPLLLLDEPMTGVDKSGLEVFYSLVTKLLERYHTSIIMVSHDLNLVAKYADQVAFLDEGKIKICDAPQVVFKNPDVLEAFGRVLTKGGGADA